MDCIFCKIVEGKIPCEKIYEDVNIISFLDIAPVNKGHALVLPKKHFETILDAEEETLKNLINAVKKISSAVMKSMKADGFNIGINNYRAAGQVVPHLHIHIIPRFRNDGLKEWLNKKATSEELQKNASEIKKFL